MAKKKGGGVASIPISVDESTAPETDYEHSQRFLNDIDRNVFQGTHPPSGANRPRAIIHRMSIAERAPHIYKESK